MYNQISVNYSNRSRRKYSVYKCSLILATQNTCIDNHFVDTYYLRFITKQIKKNNIPTSLNQLKQIKPKLNKCQIYKCDQLIDSQI